MQLFKTWTDLNQHFNNNNIPSFIEVKSSSANAGHLFFPDEKHPNAMVLKLQTDPTADPIINDVYVNVAVNQIFPKFKSFQVLRGAFTATLHEPGTKDLSGNPVYNYVTDRRVTNSTHKQCPCIVLDRVAQANTLDLYLMNKQTQGLGAAILPFINELVVAGSRAAFVHHDLHTANILFSSLTKAFTLIDYGRSHVCVRASEEKKKCKDQLNLYTEMLGHFPGFDYNTNNIYQRLVPTNKCSASDSTGDIVYILTDIAGLSSLLLDHYKLGDLTSSKNLIELMPRIITYLNGTQPDPNKSIIIINTLLNYFQTEFMSGTNAMANLNRNDGKMLTLAMSIGYIWYYLIEQRFSGHGWGRKFDYKAPHFRVINMELLKANMALRDDIYATFKMIMIPLILKWREILKSLHNHRQGGQHGGREVVESTRVLSGVKENSQRQASKSIDVMMKIISSTGDISSVPKVSQPLLILLDMNDDWFIDLHLNNENTLLLRIGEENWLEKKIKVDNLLKRLRDEDKEAKWTEEERLNIKKLGGAKEHIGSLRVVRIERACKRRYVKLNKVKWYMDEHRGQYRYTNSDKTHLVVLGNKKKR